MAHYARNVDDAEGVGTPGPSQLGTGVRDLRAALVSFTAASNELKGRQRGLQPEETDVAHHVGGSENSDGREGGPLFFPTAHAFSIEGGQFQVDHEKSRELEPEPEPQPMETNEQGMVLEPFQITGSHFNDCTFNVGKVAKESNEDGDKSEDRRSLRMLRQEMANTVGVVEGAWLTRLASAYADLVNVGRASRVEDFSQRFLWDAGYLLALAATAGLFAIGELVLVAGGVGRTTELLAYLTLGIDVNAAILALLTARTRLLRITAMQDLLDRRRALGVDILLRIQRNIESREQLKRLTERYNEVQAQLEECDKQHVNQPDPDSGQGQEEYDNWMKQREEYLIQLNEHRSRLNRHTNQVAEFKQQRAEQGEQLATRGEELLQQMLTQKHMKDSHTARSDAVVFAIAVGRPFFFAAVLLRLLATETLGSSIALGVIGLVFIYCVVWMQAKEHPRLLVGWIRNLRIRRESSRDQRRKDETVESDSRGRTIY
ncbi:hypothetical protein C8F01DRAFT_1370453, partial [Mycena amicta]